MSLLVAYHLYIMIAVLIILFFLPSEYRKKKSFLILTIALAFSIAYELIAKEPVTNMPRSISRALNQGGPEESENAHYMKDPIQRSKERYTTPTK